MRKLVAGASIALGLLLLSGCAQRLVDFTIISTKNVPITEQSQLQKAQERVTGKDTKWSILIIPLGYPSMKEAIDRAIEKYPGAVALTDGVVYSKGWTCILFGKNQYVVEGTPLYSGNGRIVPPNRYDTPKANEQPQNTPGDAIRVTHLAKAGETVKTIATLYNVSLSDILKWNQLSSIDIPIGTKLVIYIR